MNNTGFHSIILDIKENLFSELSTAIDFETTGKGRLGNHLVNVSDKGVPIVRTTTKYAIPAQNFSATHHTIVAGINDTIRRNNEEEIPAQHFNNALIEVYDERYCKMGFHSDHSLDLENGSYIALFSCYENPDTLSAQHIRKLVVKDKVSNEEFEYPLTHNSVVLFSLATNSQFLHKIVLDAAPNEKSVQPDNKWLGITFRTSKTYIQFKDNLARFSNGELLVLANKEQETEFFKLRGEENKNLDFVYPNLFYTVNIADTMLPKE